MEDIKPIPSHITIKGYKVKVVHTGQVGYVPHKLKMQLEKNENEKNNNNIETNSTSQDQNNKDKTCQTNKIETAADAAATEASACPATNEIEGNTPLQLLSARTYSPALQPI